MKKIAPKFLLLLVILFASACGLNGLFTQKGGDSGGSGGPITLDGQDENGIVTAFYSANSGSTQVLGASGDSAISGSSVSFPAGSLAIDTEITIEEGASIAGSSLANELGVSGGLAASGRTVVISSSNAQDAAAPFSLQIPISGASLALAASTNYVVVYKVLNNAENNFFVGLIPGNKLTVSNKFLTFETKYFGAYQVAITEEKISKALEAKSETPILTAAEESALKEIKWSLGTPTFNASTRKASFRVAVTGFDTLVRCSISVYESKDGSVVYSDFVVDEETLDEGKSDTVEYEDENTSAHKLYAKFECEDKKGRRGISDFSSALSVPAAEEEEEEEEESNSLAFTGNSLVSSDPRTRVVILNGTFTLTGTCDSSYQVKIEGWDIYDDQLVNCSSGTFSAIIGYDVNVASTTTYLTDDRGGKEVVVSQTGQDSIRTILFKATAANDITYIGQASDADTTALSPSLDVSASKFYVLEEDVDLSGAWTPLGDNTTPFAGVFEGNNKTISDITITAASDYVGFFGKTDDAAVIKNLKLANVNITVAGSYDNVGALAGYLGAGPVISVGVEGAITYSSGTSQYVGGLAGYSYTPYVLRTKAAVNISGGSYVDYVGGLIGMADAGLVEDAYSTGTVSGANKVGGFIGSFVANSGSMVAKAYSTGSVTCTGAFCGGFVGSTTDQELISSAFTVSSITPGSGAVGGFAGSYASYYLSATYFTNAQTYPLGNNVDVASAAECEKVSNVSSFNGSSHAVYSGWDFTQRWRVTSTYPQFVWE